MRHLLITLIFANLTVLSVAMARASESERPVFISSVIMCTDGKCFSGTANTGPQTYSECVAYGRSSRDYLRSQAFVKPAGKTKVLHFCMNLETQTPDDASAWNETFVGGEPMKH